MKTKIIYFLLFSLVTSCSLFNVRNVGNNHLIRNKKFKTPKHINYLFNPEVITYVSDSTKFFQDYHKDPLYIKKFNTLLTEKAKKTNIIFDTYHPDVYPQLTIDYIMLSEYSEIQTVSMSDCTEEDDIAYHVVLKIVANLRYENNTKRVEKSYEFSSEPRESLLINGVLGANSNENINMTKVRDNL
ncbi:hypothetical protein [Winogradskyella sp. 3972H.M.0a.05]|uniref:hypothetical protein n=1 Tax=Winogradskyella sp. 3972H.M.0a.05 TaxID=2950277 RepID=UPI003393A8B7